MQVEDYATEPVPQSVSVGGMRIGLLNGAMAFAVPGLVTGLELGGELGLNRSIWAFCLGGFLLAVLGSITGIVGQFNRLTTCMTITCVFGRGGAVIVNLLIAASLLGWYGVNMDLFSDSVCQFVLSWLQIEVSPMLVEIIGGVAMTLTTIFGFRLISRLSSLLVPLMIAVVVFMIYRIMSLPAVTIENPVATDMSFGDGVSIVVGSFIVGIVLMPDFTRFAGKPGDAITASFIAFFFLATFVYIVAAVSATRMATTDVIELLMALGMGTSALALIVVSSWLTNVINLYGAGLGFNALLPNLREYQIIIVAGILGTIAASMNILDQFTDFLFGLAIVFAPLAGIYIADFFLCRRRIRYNLKKLDDLDLIGWPALISWGAGIAVSYASQTGYLSLMNLEAVEATMAAMLAYILIKRLEVRINEKA